MIDIKFREWNGYEMDYEPAVSVVSTASINDVFTNRELMRYTGLKDKYENPIYEGDILRSVNHYENKKPIYNYHKVVFNSEYFGYAAINLSNKSESLSVAGNCQLFVYIRYIEPEVIGNVHQNPELLK